MVKQTKVYYYLYVYSFFILNSLLSRLFYRLTFRQSRAALCDVFTAMSDTDPTMADIARLMRQLNSWDRKHVDERDYSYRLAGFRLANERLASMETIDVVFLTPVMYNCLYMIMKVRPKIN